MSDKNFKVKNGLDVNGAATINTGSSSAIGLIVKSVSGQTANLQEWQNDSGTAVATITPLGILQVPQINSTSSGKTFLQTNADTGGFLLQTNGAANKALVLRGSASQTADIQQWQDSNSNTLAAINSTQFLLQTNSTSSARGLVLRQSNDGVQAAAFGAQKSRGTNQSPAVVSTGDIIGAFTYSGYNGTSYPVDVSLFGASVTNVSGSTISQSLFFITGSAAGNYNPNLLIHHTGGIGIGGSFGSIISSLVAPTAALQVNSIATATPVLISRGAASQTGNLQEWQNSAGTILNAVTSSGTLVLGGSSPVNSNFGLTLVNKTMAFYYTANNSVYNGVLSFTRGNTTGAWMNLGSTGDSNNGVASISISDGGNNNLFTVGYSGNTSLVPTSATTVPLTVKGASSQTANIQEWQNSAGTVLSSIGSGGILNLGSGTYENYNANSSLRLETRGTPGTERVYAEFQGVAANDVTNENGGAFIRFRTSRVEGYGADIGAVRKTLGASEFRIKTGDTTANNIVTRLSINESGNVLINGFTSSTIGLIIKGAVSQTANLQEWQNSAGTVLAKVESTGAALFGDGSNSSNYTRIDAFGNTNIRTGGSQYNGASLSVNTVIAAALGTVIRGASGQTADLAQFQNSSGAVLSSVNAAGTFVGNVQDSQLIQYGAEGSILQNVPTRVHPAETLLKQAVWWIDSAHSASSGQTITNLGWGGSALNVTNGSSASADSNDAKYLDWDGINYVYLPSGSNTVTAPGASLKITGDLDIRTLVAFDDWTPGDIRNIVVGTANWPSPGYKSWNFQLQTNGTLRFVISTDGTNQLNYTSSVAPTVTDGSQLWIRVTRSKAAGEIKFFTSADGITWTQLGTTVTGATTSDIYYNALDTGVIQFGQIVTVYNCDYKFYRAQILNGIDGTPVLDVDTSVISSGSATSFTALTGQTVTINRSTSGRKTVCVTHPVWLFGTDDYMEVNNRWLEHTGTNYLYLPGVAGNYASAPDSAALDITGDIDIRCKVALDDWTPSTSNILVAKRNTNSAYQFFVNNGAGLLGFLFSIDGTATIQVTSTVSPTVSDGSILWVRVTRVASTGVIQFFTSTDGTTWTQLGVDVSSTSGNIYSSGDALEIGTRSLGTNLPARGKFFRAMVLNGIGGTVAFDANFETGITTNLPTTFTESSANAATVTVNYSGTSYRSAGVIASTYVFPGNPNTFKLSNYSLLDFGATDDFTVMMINRQWATPQNYGVQYIKGQDVVAPSWYSYNQATAATQTFEMKSGATTIARTGATITLGAMSQHGAVINRTAQTVAAITNGTLSATSSISGLGSLSTPLYTLRTVAGDNYELIAFAIFRRALTAAEIATLNSYFQGRVA